MFGFTFAFLGFCVVIIWATVLEPRSRLPNAVNAVYWVSVVSFAASLLVSVVWRPLAEVSSGDLPAAFVYAPTAAQLFMAIAMMALAGLTAHRVFFGGPDDEEPVEEAPP